MASYSVEEFLGDGQLKGVIPKLAAEGWDDVPTLKMMNSEQMDGLKLTQHQKDALEIRSYLHDRFLMDYAERLEASRKSLSELLALSTIDLSSQYGMKRGHIARFIDKASYQASYRRASMPSSRMLPTRETIISSSSKSSLRESRKMQNVKSSLSGSSKYEVSINEDYIFKGIVAAQAAEPRRFGRLQPPIVSEPRRFGCTQPLIVDGTAPYSSIENITIQKLTPDYKIGMELLVKVKGPPMKASHLWHDKPAILFCVRRPGCIMCRAQAHQLYERKHIFDALGFNLIAVLHEQIESEVKDFWPRYWGGVVILDRSMNFFKALGGGKLLKDKFVSGFLLNPRAIANFKRAIATGIKHNFRGEGEIKGGLFIIGRGKSGIAYQFTEENFGDWVPINEVVEICSRLQNGQAYGNRH